MKIKSNFFKNLTLVDIAYGVFLGVFSIVILIELVKYLVEQYSFLRAAIVFAGITIVYVLYKNGVFTSTEMPSGRKTMKKGTRISQKKNIAFISSHILSALYIVYAFVAILTLT